jgi:hypothetical protein
MDTHMNEFNKYQNIRHIAKRLAEEMTDKDHVENATEVIVELAGAITARDMSGYATKSDIAEVKQEIAEVKIELKHEIELLKQFTRSDMAILRKDLIIWILGGSFVINQLPHMFTFVGKVLGKW